MRMQRLIVLGADTDAGKTTFSLLWLAAFPGNWSYWKPVETGDSDSETIRRLVPMTDVLEPAASFQEAVAPALAAAPRRPSNSTRGGYRQFRFGEQEAQPIDRDIRQPVLAAQRIRIANRDSLPLWPHDCASDVLAPVALSVDHSPTCERCAKSESSRLPSFCSVSRMPMPRNKLNGMATRQSLA